MMYLLELSCFTSDHRHHSYCRAPLPCRHSGKVDDYVFSQHLNFKLPSAHEHACDSFQCLLLVIEDVDMFSNPPCIYYGAALHGIWNHGIHGSENVSVPYLNLQMMREDHHNQAQGQKQFSFCSHFKFFIRALETINTKPFPCFVIQS